MGKCFKTTFSMPLLASNVYKKSSTDLVWYQITSASDLSMRRYLMNMKSDFIKKFNLNMVTSNTMGFRVTMVDYMYLWAVG